MRDNNNLWVWGYVLDKIPDNVLFTDRRSFCSLETAAEYLGADNVVFMNSAADRNALNDGLFQHLSKCKRIVCGLQHGAYVETARMVSEFAANHPNIVGVNIDDFHCLGSPSEHMTVDELREIREALDSVTKGLKLYVVCYFYRFGDHSLEQFRDLFDGINVWCWTSTTHFWKGEYEYTVQKLHRDFPDKEILQGQFMHEYGDGFLWEGTKPQPMDMLELQCDKISDQLRDGTIKGWVVLQNGFFSYPDHRRQVQFLRDYFDWMLGTWTSL